MIIYYTKEGKFKTEDISILSSKILHRLNGPAVIDSEGNKQWRVNNIWHRLDGPAVILYNDDKFWYKHGKRHRLDGPAIELSYLNCWFINGKELNKKEVENWIKDNNINLKTKIGQSLFILRFG